MAAKSSQTNDRPCVARRRDFKDKTETAPARRTGLFPLDREALSGTKVIKLKWRMLRSLPLSYARTVLCVLRSPVDDDRSVESHRSSLTVHANRSLARSPTRPFVRFVSFIRSLLQRQRHAVPNVVVVNRPSPAGRLVLAGLFLALRLGLVVSAHEGRDLAYAELAIAQGGLLLTSALELRHPSKPLLLLILLFLRKKKVNFFFPASCFSARRAIIFPRIYAANCREGSTDFRVTFVCHSQRLSW